MSTVSLMTSLVTEDCSRFLPPQHKTLGRRLFGDMSVVRHDPLTTQNANVIDLEGRRHAADCQPDSINKSPLIENAGLDCFESENWSES